MKNQSPIKEPQPIASVRLIIKSYPIHTKNELMTYNIYSQDPVNGVTDSLIIKYPCIREGCMTNCYFDGKITTPSLIAQPCFNCGNQNAKRIFLDVGYQTFLQKHYKYIKINEPLNVEINPISKEYLFSSNSLRNNLYSQLSSYIANKIFDDSNFRQTMGINAHILDFPKINQQLQGIMTPVIKSKQYYLYSFCKYVPYGQDDQEQIHIFLFILGQNQPVKARIIIQNSNSQICQLQHYLSFVMINFIGDINTLIFAVPQAGSTEYYVANLSYHFSLDQKILRVIHMKDWKDPQGRFHGSLIVDQKSATIFVIGGYDTNRNDSLDYISCFLKCRWARDSSQKNQFKAQIDKSHKLFQGRVGAYNTGMFNTVFKNPYNENKIAFKNSTFMIYSFNREFGQQEQKQYLQNSQKLKKNFFNLGGGLKDSTIFATGRFSTKPPGIRYLKYDPSSEQNPIVNESAKAELNFVGNNYIIIQLPCFISGKKKKFKNHCIVLGGKKDSSQIAKKVNNEQNNFEKIYLIDTNNLEHTIELSQKFYLSEHLLDNLDQFSIIVADSQTKNHYLRSTYPLKRPIQIKDFYIHYIILEFGLATGLVQISPGKIAKKK